MTRVKDPGPIESWTEGEFQSRVIGIARQHGWGISQAEAKKLDADLAVYAQPAADLDGLIFHPRVMYRSEPGWPDLTLIRRRDRRLVFAELKTEKRESQLSTRQRKVLELLACLETPVCDCGRGLIDVAEMHRQLYDVPAELAHLPHKPSCPAWEALHGVRIQVFVWRPRDLDAIAAVLA